MDQLPIELNVITLNCWGRRYTSSHREDRMGAIGRYLATTDPVPHIVALQECFEYGDYLNIRHETRYALPFGKFYHSGASSCGLAILSRWPIEESNMVPFSFCGRPSGLLRGDVGSQGVACARIRYGEGEEDVVEVFNTNIRSNYGDSSRNNSYMIHRLSQTWEIAKLVRNAAERGHLAVVLADLNTTPFSLPYRLLTSHAAIRDAWRVLHPESSLGSASNELERARGSPIPTAATNITENGVTSNSAYNTWAWPSSEKRALRSGKRPMLISPERPDADGQRVDYIFFSRGGDPHASPTDLSEILSAHNTFTDDGTGFASSPPGWVVKDVRVGLMARHPDLGCSLSDHFSVEATLVLHTPTPINHRRRRRSSSKSRSRSRSRSNSRAISLRLADEALMSVKKPGSGFQSQTPRVIPSTPVGTNHRSNSTAKEKGKSRGRAATPHSFTSTDAGAHIAAVEQGAYLHSPTASSYRRGSRDQTAFDLQLSSLDLGTPPRLPTAAYDEIINLINAHAVRTYWYQLLGITHFVWWAIFAVGSFVAIWFLPNGKGAFGLLAASSLGLAAGVVTLLLALFFYSTELNRLNEFEWEIRNAKAVISGMGPEALAHQGSEEEKVW
ncbi:Endonuclease/exonuclease/phosphatase [Xylaria arbuscula]|nr:Endonuclease/exonuclease/phosphatase [Xylaria arbuscula]